MTATGRCRARARALRGAPERSSSPSRRPTMSSAGSSRTPGNIRRLRRGREGLALERLDAIAGHAVRGRGSLVFGALLAVDPRQPGDAQHAGMTLEQPGAEGLEFAAGDLLVGRFRTACAARRAGDVLAHAVLHDDGLGFGDVLELDLVDAIFPSRHGSGADERKQQADADCDERRAIESEQRRGAPPSGHTFSILIVPPADRPS